MTLDRIYDKDLIYLKENIGRKNLFSEKFKDTLNFYRRFNWIKLFSPFI